MHPRFVIELIHYAFRILTKILSQNRTMGNGYKLKVGKWHISQRDINENCRLIFLICIVFKLMESFAKESITTYVGFENLYHQCKFINRRFTAKQLLLYFEQIRTTVSVGVVQSAYNAWSYCKNLFFVWIKWCFSNHRQWNEIGSDVFLKWHFLV